VRKAKAAAAAAEAAMPSRRGNLETIVDLGSPPSKATRARGERLRTPSRKAEETEAKLNAGPTPTGKKRKKVEEPDGSATASPKASHARKQRRKTPDDGDGDGKDNAQEGATVAGTPDQSEATPTRETRARSEKLRTQSGQVDKEDDGNPAPATNGKRERSRPSMDAPAKKTRHK